MESIGVPITINAANSTVIDNYRYSFAIRGGLQLKDMEVALVKGFIFNSVFNVKQSVLTNNVFQYRYPNGAGFDTHTVTLQDGHYDVDTINDYLQQVMFDNKTYLIDADGNNVFYIALNVNPVFYAVALQCTPVPISLPTNWTLPVGAPALPMIASTPQFAPGLNFGKLIGYDPVSYPSIPQSTKYLVIGTTEAEINPQYAFNVCLNVVNMPLVNSVPSTIFPFSFKVGFMGQEILDPYVHKYYPCTDGKYSTLILTILDQQNRPAILNTKSAQFTVEFRKQSKA
jgi:hypothetical protein